MYKLNKYQLIAANIYICQLLYTIDISETVNLIYTTCAFETALNRSIISPWCKIFSSNDFKVRFKLK